MYKRQVINPATEEVIGKASKANSSDVQKALKSAEKGLQIWKNTSPWERSKIIRKISDLIRKCCILTVYNETYFNEKESEKELQKQKYRIKLAPS